MDTYIEFNRITFGLPVERFQIEAYIALEERLPVVTEYLLRLLRICGCLPLHSIRDYFGFSDAEVLSIIESLSRQGLLEVKDDEAKLSQFAGEKFDAAGSEHPRFSKVELRYDDVIFDLMTFSPLNLINLNYTTDNIIKMEAAEESVGHSIEKARDAYHQHYHEIAGKRAELRDKSYGIYSIESVESKRRSYVPIPVSFMLDRDLQVKRAFDEVFETAASSELIQEITEKVSVEIKKSIPIDSTGIEEFINAFNIQVLGKYLIGNKFDLKSYLTDVHLDKTQKYPKGTAPIFGNLYLTGNREHILTRLKHRRLGQHKHGKLTSSLTWLMPDCSLWGRGDSLSETVNTITGILRDGDSSDDLFLCAYAENYDQQRITYEYKIPGLKELHFIKPLLPEGRLMDGRLEIILYPTAFVFAIYHLPIPGNSGLWAPIGFVSSQPKHLDIAHKLIRKTMGGERYGGRAQFSQSDKRPRPNTFEDGFPFLNYESLLTQHLSQDEEDDIETESNNAN